MVTTKKKMIRKSLKTAMTNKMKRTKMKQSRMKKIKNKLKRSKTRTSLK